MQLVFWALAVGLGVISAVDGAPCDYRYAKHRNPIHVMCESNTCFDGIERIERGFNIYQKMAVLEGVNRIRSAVARGLVPAYPPAKQMNELQWDDEIGEIAQRLTDFCGGFRKKYNFSLKDGTRLSNYIEVTYPYTKKLPDDFVVMLLSSAFEKKGNKVKLNPQTVVLNREIAQILPAKAERFGCGYTSYRSNSQHELNIRCFVAPGLWQSNDTYYDIGALDCPVASVNYKGLCSTAERNAIKIRRLPCDRINFAKLANHSYFCGDEQHFFDKTHKGIPFPPYECNFEDNKSLFHTLVALTVLGYLPLLFIPFWPYLKILKSKLPPLPPLPKLRVPAVQMPKRPKLKIFLV